MKINNDRGYRKARNRIDAGRSDSKRSKAAKAETLARREIRKVKRGEI